jgi:hypothetical protein
LLPLLLLPIPAHRASRSRPVIRQTLCNPSPSPRRHPERSEGSLYLSLLVLESRFYPLY